MGPPASFGIEESLSGRPPLLDPLTPSDYLVIEVPIGEEPERPAFALRRALFLQRLARRGLRVLHVAEQVELGPDGKGLCMGYHGRGRKGSLASCPGLKG